MSNQNVVAPAGARHARLRLPALSVESVAFAASLFFSLLCNIPFWHAMFDGRDWNRPHSWLFAAALIIAVTTLQFAALAVVLNRWTVKPLLSLLFVTTAFAVFFMERYGVFYDTDMIRNVLATDMKESRDMLTPGLLPHLLFYAVLPIVTLWCIRVKRTPLPRALIVRCAAVLGALVVSAGLLLLVYQDFTGTMRTQKAARHLITPGNYIVSLAKVLATDTATAGQERIAVGLDAKRAGAAPGRKPVLLVLVVGETARAANWGLNGYPRQTTPELAGLDVVNFGEVSSCGTSTEVSLPCMFSHFGRRNYDQRAIRSHESLLHVLDHAGVRTLWRDNQSGCKGVCAGLEQEALDGGIDPVLCPGGRCLDEILLSGLAAKAASAPGDLVVVLHQLGNHGPAYFRRYPPAFRRFTPTCDTEELGGCSRQEIVNAYDNALLYTDHVLAETIRLLGAQTSHEAVMVYVSDHGESLGEHGLFLHGMPYLVAPSEQTHVPMVFWASPDFAAGFRLDLNCMKERAGAPTSHDALFHTVLGVLQVETAVYDASMDLTAACRGNPAAGPGAHAAAK